ncbi:uncharacterized protein A4U43_C05F16410 [Asparagus officinalis]|uniref:GTD-binding domain-containing protein n=1 Tax=Asparagus officinalis TaxID=4686 RepID=A0A5P1ES10_ASPOF|nr:uncharacterized protein A4U43_C05F16410 [Asparagus officinalis]
MPLPPPLPDYPPLRCKMPEQDNEDFPATDLDKYAFGETPRDQIQNLEQRICKMERMPSTSHEKGVIAFSPRKPQHSRRVSMESFGDDDSSDRVRVYTVDRVHCVPESCMSTPRELGKNDNGEEFSGNEEEEIKRLNLRLQALEADREAMRQTMMSMGTDKAQLVLLKEIAQQLCKEVKPQAQQKLVKKPSSVRSLSIGTATKLITSFVLWRRKALRTKYTFGITNSNSGLLLLLNKSPRLKQKRSLSKVLR